MADRQEEDSGWKAAAGWLVGALALRLFLLGRPSLWADEVYSLDDALNLFTPGMTASDLSFPVFYLLERAVLELCGLAGAAAPDPATLQWVLRIVPAVAGALAAAAAFVGARGFLSRRERHLLAAFLTFSPWLLYFSQTARFYALLVAVATPATFELLRASREASMKHGVRAALWLLLATLVHPTALFLLVGHVAAAFTAALLRVRPLHRGLVAPLLLPVVLAIPPLIWPGTAAPLVYRWSAHDAGVESVGSLLLGIGWNVGPVVAALAFLGIPSLWRRDRALALEVVVGIGVPVAALLGLALGAKSVEQRYLLALVPLTFVPAAVFVAELSETSARAGTPRWALPLLALLPWGPGVVSEFIDGNRHDLAGAAAIVRANLAPGDGVVADYHALMRRYLPADFPPSRLLEAPPPPDAQDRAQFDAMWSGCGRLWIVVPADFDAMNATHRAFQEWAWREGRLVRELWRPRLDYHQNRLRVFLVETKEARRWRAP